MVQLRSVQELNELGIAIFTAAGASDENARGVMSALIGANLAGHDSHGVIRISSYVEDIRNGRLKPAAVPEVVHESAATALVDGAFTFGQLGARLSAVTAATKAAEAGMGGAALYGAHHTGRIGEWAEVGAERGMITLVAASGAHGPHQVAPFGGRARALGTNPIAWSVPRRGGQPPILLDFATSGAAQGKLMVARAKRQKLPEGWILDSEGRPSTNVEDFYAGGVLLPFAGHKGYALAVIVELLAVGLSGGQAVPGIERGSCLFIACVNPSAFPAAKPFDDSVDSIAERLKSIAPAEGFNEILLPGEPELRAREQRGREGVPLPDATWEAIAGVARDLGVDAG